MSAPIPVLIPEPFANDAGPSFINVIPATTADPQRAAYDEGFPPQTFQSEGSGGKPPLGQDFNGIFNAITQHLFALQGGQLRAWDSAVRDALGGYALGAIVAMADGAGWWISVIEDNGNASPDLGGAGWEAVYAYGPATISGLTGGVYTLSPVEASRPFLILSGTLSGNQQVVVPNSFRHWLVINLCVMGGNTLTVKTAAGTGVAVPAGGTASPTAIYCDTVNVNPVFVPSALPTDVNPSPDTIVLRDNTGAAYGTTAALGDSSSALATTEFVNRGSSLASNGWILHPNGLIEQWGFNSGAGSNRTVTYPIPFPNAIYNVQTSPRRTTGDALGQAPTVIGSPGLANFTLAPADGSTGTDWRALGR
jgi:hypothetical protein